MSKTHIQVLLVEDNPADVLFLREALEKDPLTTFELTTVERLSAALDSLRQTRCEVILLDLGLPDSQGAETFRQVQRQAPELPVVVFSGNRDEQAAIEAVRAGAQDYLVKGPAAWGIAARTIRYAVERQQIGRQLRASEKHWRTLLEQNHDAIALAAADGTLLYTSPAVTRVLGYTPAELLGRNALEVVHPTDRAAATEDLARILNSSGETFQTQLRLIHKNGQTVWVEAANTNWLADPDLQAIVINCRDITERKLAEEKLRESEERFHSTLEAMQEGVLLIGRDWRYLYLNHSAERQERRPAEELLGKTVMECWPGIEATDFFRLEARVLQEGLAAQIEGPYTFPEGETRWFYWNIQPAPEGLLVVTQDITERKLAEAALYSEQLRFAQVAATVPGAITVLRLQPTGKMSLEYASQPFEDIFGLTSAEASANVETIIARIPPTDSQRILEQLAEFSASLQTLHFEFRYQHPHKGAI